ncbi:MAG: hypothetical protein ACRC28_16260 [Clostridium sp.]|uniref:hypothetical protein n=1 Tax=Clostridium sp. TaxID=1506 RepID=UPI003F3428D9
MSYKEFNIDNIPYEEFNEVEVRDFEKLGEMFVNIFIEKPKQIRKEIINENKKELNEEINKSLEVDERVEAKYLGCPSTGGLLGSLVTMLVTMPGAFLTNFGDRSLIVQTDRRLIIITLGTYYDFFEKVNIRFKDIEKIKINRTDKIVFIRRKKVINIKDYFFPTEWRIPRNFKMYITSENYEKLFVKLDKLTN